MSTTTPTDVFTQGFWVDVLHRLYGQARQTLLPVLILVFHTTGVLDVRGVVVTVGGALALTIVKAVLTSLLGIAVPIGAPWYMVLVDRALPALAGVLLGALPADWSGIHGMHWSDVLVAAVTAAVLAMLDNAKSQSQLAAAQRATRVSYSRAIALARAQNVGLAADADVARSGLLPHQRTPDSAPRHATGEPPSHL